MRSVSWETSDGALAAFLNSASSNQLYMVDLYTVTLNNGDVLRWNGSDADVEINGLLFSRDPVLVRGSLTNKVGVEVATLDLTIYPNTEAGGTFISGVPVIPFIAGGGLDGARIDLERVFSQGPGQGFVGSILIFSGRVGEADCTRHSAELTVNSDLDLLNLMVPRNLYESSCLNTLYDGSCKLSKPGLSVTGVVSIGNSRNSFTTGLIQVDAWFSLGVITFTSGQNEGQIRTIKNYVHANGTIVTIYPLPFIPTGGDQFIVYPGCDKTLDTCTNKFNNRIHFRGFKFIPIPETVT